MTKNRPNPRPGFVLEVDRQTPPILFHHGEGFRLEKLPVGRSRVVYPGEPLHGIPNPDLAIAEALENPIDEDPLPSLLKPGMKLTIAFDDISLPLPPMQRPDIRQRVIEAVLDHAAAAGVDDVHIVAALCLHRRMTEDRTSTCRRRSGVRGVRTVGSVVQPRRRGPRRHGDPGTHRPRRGRPDVQAGRRERPGRLRQHQPGQHGWRLEEHRHRTVRLRRRARPSQRAHDAPLEELHGSGSLRAPPIELAPGCGDQEERASDLPDRNDCEYQRVRPGRADGRAAETGVGMVATRSSVVRRHAGGSASDAVQRPAPGLSHVEVSVRDDLGPGR